MRAELPLAAVIVTFSALQPFSSMYGIESIDLMKVPNPWLLSDAIISLSLMVSLLMMIPDEPAKPPSKREALRPEM